MLRTTTRSALLLFVIGLTFASTASAADTYGANAPGNLIVNSQVTEQASTLTTNLLSDRIGQAVNSGIVSSVAGLRQRGMSAGGSNRSNAIWLTAGANFLKNDNKDQGFNGVIQTIAGGLDRWVTDNLLFGLAGGHEQIDLDTLFNNGKLKSHGWAVAPYMAYRVSPSMTVDAILGHTWLRYDEVHAGSAGPSVTGEFDANRVFAAVDLNQKWKVQGWNIASSLGYLYVHENQDAFVESNNNQVTASTPHAAQVRATATIGHETATSWGSIMPYFYGRAGRYIDQSQAPLINAKGERANWDPWTAEGGLGLEAKIGDGAVVRLQGTKSWNGDIKNNGVNLTVRNPF